MTDISRAFLEKSRNLIAADYLPKIERAIDRLSDSDIWWRPNDASNSIGNLMLHLAGNVTMWIIGGVGNRTFERHRRRLNTVVHEADEIVGAVGSSELLSRRLIQGYDVSVLEAIYHVVEHFGMHTGQIILLSKIRLGEDLTLWEAPNP